MSPQLSRQDLPVTRKKDRRIRDRYRWFFFSADLEADHGRVHIHVVLGESAAKFWLTKDEEIEVSLGYNLGFREDQIGEVRRFIEDHVTLFLAVWSRYFGIDEEQETYA